MSSQPAQRVTSILEVALSYEHADLRAEFENIEALRRELLGLAKTRAEVAATKIAWWRRALNTDERRHPALAKLHIDTPLPLFTEFLIEAEARHHGEAAQTEDESRLRLLRVYATPWQALLSQLGANDLSNRRLASSIALAYALARGARLGLYPGMLCPAWKVAASAEKTLASAALDALDEIQGVTGLRSLDILAALTRADCLRILADKPPLRWRLPWTAWRIARNLDYH